MKQSLAALELHYVVDEMQFLVGGKLDKVYNPSKKELILQFHVPSKGKQMVRLVAGKVLYLTNYRGDMGEASGFCMYLRKKLLGARLKGIVQREFERVVEFEFEGKDGKQSLFVELFGKGNIALVKDGVILSVVEQQKWADRSVMPGQEYIYPHRMINLLTMSLDEFRSFVKTSKQETVVKMLALEVGLGGVYAEEACLRAGIDKNSSPVLGRIKSEKLYKVLKLFIGKGKGYMYDGGVEISPIKLEGCESCAVKGYSTYNEALDEYFTLLLRSAAMPGKSKEMQKVENIIFKQQNMLNKLERLEIENREKGELLYKRYQLVSSLLLQLRDASKKFPADEIRKRLKGQKWIREYDAKEKSVVVELEDEL